MDHPTPSKIRWRTKEQQHTTHHRSGLLKRTQFRRLVITILQTGFRRMTGLRPWHLTGTMGSSTGAWCIERIRVKIPRRRIFSGWSDTVLVSRLVDPFAPMTSWLHLVSSVPERGVHEAPLLRSFSSWCMPSGVCTCSSDRTNSTAAVTSAFVCTGRAGGGGLGIGGCFLD